MKRYMIHLNSRRCVACYGCTVHCKVNKDLPVGPMLCEVNCTPLQMVGGVPKVEFTFSACRHCDEPLCLPVCPTEAMVQRDDGIVYIDEEKMHRLYGLQKELSLGYPGEEPGQRKSCEV